MTEDDSTEAFGPFLRRLRQAAGRSVQEVAKDSGLAAQHIYRLERGLRPPGRASTLTRLALALRVPPEILLRAAGHLSEAVEEGNDPVMAMLFRAARDLSDEQKQEIVEYIQFRKRQWRRESERRRQEPAGGGDDGPADQER